MHTSTNQFIPRALSDLSSFGHIHINRKRKDKWKKKSKKWVRKRDTGFPVRKRITLEKTNRIKRSLAPKCQAFTNGSDLDGGLTVYEKAFKYSCKKNFTLLYNNMKMPIIEDPFLIMTFQTAYEPLIDIKLCQHDQQKIIHLALRKTCRYSKVNTTTIFTKENRNIFSQETYGLYLLLTKRFELQDSFINKASHSFNSLFDWSKLSSPWGELKQTSFDLLKADLALELVDLDTDLCVQDFFFVFAAKARSLAPQYFERRVSENLQIINEGIELAQSKRADKHAIIISSAKKLNIVRSQTLVQEFDKTFPNLGSYKELFCSVTGEQRIVSDRKPFDFLNLVLPD
uniref:hypothetical protein n=1 Tax=Klebsormidium crenulatum TaxID=424406 RepID=UPI00286C9EC5|nr:hypothetical protein RMD54_pgp047 [Klebsormidium crenulatum]WKT06385.1 hypothetical protein [Klebsormidium crenulatum]